ncbi:hypothetical protein M5K25_010182 [Dendrobium thyrsiflorum]|uniref:RRM domain-containing protein n=1 Tax=Dendrobium thyrsiflorum TaxID=117978 RepID=A0ABD0V064_DENTH
MRYLAGCLALCALLLHIYRNALASFPAKPSQSCFASLPNCLHEEIKASLMESEKEKVAASTNDSVDNDGAHFGRPCWNLLLEKHMRSLLSTLEKHELVNLHVKLAKTVPQAAEEIRAAARSPDPAHRKLFVYGFGDETTSETLCEALSSYGEIEEGQVMVDDATGKSRHFGIIIFKNIESVTKALEREEGTMVDGRLAFHHPVVEGFDVESRRLYVEDLSTDITTEMFRSFFEKYGEIEEGSVVYDKITGKSRGIGFVTFKTSYAAMKAIIDPEKKLGTNRISVSRARIRRVFQGKKKQAQESVIYGSPSQVSPPDLSGNNKPHGVPLASPTDPTE